MIGLCSVTFRKKTPAEIVQLAVKADLDGVEWGGDVHVCHGDIAAAESVKQLSREAGLGMMSYGSYYTLCKNDLNFNSVLETAVSMESPNIRIWAGSFPPSEADDEYYKRAADELDSICQEAKKSKITISLEFHRNTLTQTSESTMRLMKMANSSNLFTYWQPNPDIINNESELNVVLPKLSNIHVFHWVKNEQGGSDKRCDLKRGEVDWEKYIKIAGVKRNYFLEFIKDDCEENFHRDAQTLRRMMIE